MKQEIKRIAKQAAEKLAKQSAKHSYIPASGKIFDEKELQNMIEASLEGWWTDGVWVEKFEAGLKEYLGAKYLSACSSGSSANLLAFSALRSTTLGGKRIKPGSEVISVAASFPTTINAIIQNGCIPVFVDITLPTYNIDVSKLEKALSCKTRAVMVAHTLGNPFDLTKVKAFCRKHDLWLVEDNCDALGSMYKGKPTGTFGDIATLSFYPAHHITTAEGGAVITNNAELFKIVRSIRDWGRHCWCQSGKDNTCKNRFNWKLGDLPEGYDHKYIYNEVGYNLKMSDLHAAIGVAQIKKLDGFVKKRISNFSYLTSRLKEFEQYFMLPEATEGSQPSWFGYLLTIKDPRIDRPNLLKYLESKGIGTRLLFAGNITKQPYFINGKLPHRVSGSLVNTDIVMNRSFWVGCYPGIGKSEIDKIYEEIKNYLKQNEIN